MVNGANAHSHINRCRLVCWWAAQLKHQFSPNRQILKLNWQQPTTCYCKPIDSSVHGLLMNFHNRFFFLTRRFWLLASLLLLLLCCCGIFLHSKRPVGCQKEPSFFSVKTSVRHNLWLFHINYNHLLVFTMCVVWPFLNMCALFVSLRHSLLFHSHRWRAITSLWWYEVQATFWLW